jgi:hypothetical protein
MLRTLFLIASLTAAPSAAAAKNPASPAPAASPAEAARLGPELAYFVGTWAITAVDPRTGEKEGFSYRVEPALGGSWLSGAGASTTGDFASRDMWGRNPDKGGISRIVFSGGGTYAILRSDGWKADTLVFESESPRLRQTITRVSPNEFRAVWEMFSDGRWTAYSDERVIRSRPAHA